MNESITKTTHHFTACASLAAIVVKLRQLDLFGTIRQGVQIAQKTVKHTPIDKVYDAFIAILAGAHGLIEINTRLRSDPALQAAFGRSGCAEQSVVQETLDACTAENVKQMEQALDNIYRQHSQGYLHDFATDWQVLDVDMNDLPCAKKAAFATKDYFAKQRNRRGRQLGRVLASRYDEVVVDRLFGGTTRLTAALQPSMEAAEQTLGLDQAKRERTTVRVDAGGGSLDDANWLLAQGYQVQVGWVTEVLTAYVRPVVRIAVRCRQQNGQWAVGVLLSTLSAAEVLALTRQPLSKVSDPEAVLLAYVTFYDQHGGGIETSFKGDKQGLGISKRSKKRFEAQQMVMLLGSLVHNVIVWARQWLTSPPSPLRHYGILRMVRDVFHVSGFLVIDAFGQIGQIVHNRAAPLDRL